MANNARLKNDRGTNSLESNSSAPCADSLLEQLQFWAWDGGDATEVAAAAAVTRAMARVVTVAAATAWVVTMTAAAAVATATTAAVAQRQGQWQGQWQRQWHRVKNYGLRNGSHRQYGLRKIMGSEMSLVDIMVNMVSEKLWKKWAKHFSGQKFRGAHKILHWR